MSSKLYEALDKDGPSEALPLVRYLLKQGVQVNEKDSLSTYDTPLSIAAQKQTPEIIELLLNHGAKVNARTQDWMSPLIAAVVHGTVENCPVLLKHGAYVNIRTITGRSPLELAVRNLRTDVVKLLLDRGIDMHSVNGSGGSMLNAAIQIGYEDLKTFDVMKSWGVAESVSKNKLDIMRLLIDNGADVNTQRIDDSTGLHLATLCHDVEAVKILLDAGADPNLVDLTNRKPLWSAVRYNHGEMVKLLLPRTKHISDQLDNGDTCLSTAARCGNKESVELLLEAGAEIWSREPGPTFLAPERRLRYYGIVALYCAVDLRQNNDDIVRPILAAGANRSAKEQDFRIWLDVWDRSKPEEMNEFKNWMLSRREKVIGPRSSRLREKISKFIDEIGEKRRSQNSK